MVFSVQFEAQLSLKCMVNTSFLSGFQQPLLRSAFSFPCGHKLHKKALILAGTVLKKTPSFSDVLRCTESMCSNKRRDHRKGVVTSSKNVLTGG